MSAAKLLRRVRTCVYVCVCVLIFSPLFFFFLFTVFAENEFSLSPENLPHGSSTRVPSAGVTHVYASAHRLTHLYTCTHTSVIYWARSRKNEISREIYHRRGGVSTTSDLKETTVRGESATIYERTRGNTSDGGQWNVPRRRFCGSDPSSVLASKALNHRHVLERSSWRRLRCITITGNVRTLVCRLLHCVLSCYITTVNYEKHKRAYRRRFSSKPRCSSSRLVTDD